MSMLPRKILGIPYQLEFTPMHYILSHKYLQQIGLRNYDLVALKFRYLFFITQRYANQYMLWPCVCLSSRCSIKTSKRMHHYASNATS